MQLQYVPLLQTQRDLYAMPPNKKRFEHYIRTMTNADGSDVELVPLVAMNPMAKDHVAALLDTFLAFDADKMGANAAAEASEALKEEPGKFRASLVVVDDLKGGWTNRYAYEYDCRYPTPDHHRFWVTGYLWSSEAATERTAREAILVAAYRTAYVQREGPARSLRQLLAQEGYAYSAAGCQSPALVAEDLAYTREVLAPMLNASDKRSVIECLFGDEAARSLGFTPRGLSHWAGLALALNDANFANCHP